MYKRKGSKYKGCKKLLTFKSLPPSLEATMLTVFLLPSKKFFTY